MARPRRLVPAGGAPPTYQQLKEPLVYIAEAVIAAAACGITVTAALSLTQKLRSKRLRKLSDR
jgi:hypothetical protein